jgi:hypothetical protein
MTQQLVERLQPIKQYKQRTEEKGIDQVLLSEKETGDQPGGIQIIKQDKTQGEEPVIRRAQPGDGLIAAGMIDEQYRECHKQQTARQVDHQIN